MYMVASSEGKQLLQLHAPTNTNNGVGNIGAEIVREPLKKMIRTTEAPSNWVSTTVTYDLV